MLCNDLYYKDITHFDVEVLYKCCIKLREKLKFI